MKKRYNLGFIFFLFSCLAVAQYTSTDWKSRDKWMKINDFFAFTDIKPGYAVADVGCHEGYLTMHLAKRVGEQGKVYAVDVNDYRLQQLKKHAKKRQFQNITTVLGDYDNPKLPKETLDIVFIIDTYHEISAYKKVLKHVYQSLKPGAKLVLLEKIKKHKIGKPRTEQASAHTLSLNYVKEELQQAGFTIEREVANFGYWERNKTKQMWILIASK